MSYSVRFQLRMRFNAMISLFRALRLKRESGLSAIVAHLWEPQFTPYLHLTLAFSNKKNSLEITRLTLPLYYTNHSTYSQPVSPVHTEMDPRFIEWLPLNNPVRSNDYANQRRIKSRVVLLLTTSLSQMVFTLARNPARRRLYLQVVASAVGKWVYRS